MILRDSLAVEGEGEGAQVPAVNVSRMRVLRCPVAPCDS